MKVELDLERRVRRLEWYNRVCTLALVVMLAYCILLGARQPAVSPVAEYPRNIVAERVAVVDGEGREVAVLEASGDNGGTMRLGIAQSTMSASAGDCGACLMVIDESRNIQACLQYDKESKRSLFDLHQ